MLIHGASLYTRLILVLTHIGCFKMTHLTKKKYVKIVGDSKLGVYLLFPA
jgi:hypothetical protein